MRLDMAYDTQVVECVRDEHEGTASADAPPRERWSWTAWSSAVTVGVLGFVAVCVVVSAITVVSRQPFGDTGVVLPTVPVTTTTAPPPPPSSAAPIPPPVTRAPSAAPSAIAPTYRRNECATTAAASEAEHHSSVEHPFRTQ